MTGAATFAHSCLYPLRVQHERLAPKRHRFHYDLFYLYLDLDELAAVDAGLAPLLRVERRGPFQFRERDHWVGASGGLKAGLIDWIGTQAEAPSTAPTRLRLLTLPRALGYAFNPVSFYFCFDREERVQGVVAEVCNTFHEMKLYWLPAARQDAEGWFRDRQAKEFYISPFSAPEVELEFRLRVPGKRLAIHVNDWRLGKREFLSSMSGHRKPLTRRALAREALSYPVVPLQVMTLIHWQAFRLWLKRVPFWAKEAAPEARKDFRTARDRKRA
jgi:DUF1365 family protein